MKKCLLIIIAIFLFTVSGCIEEPKSLQFDSDNFQLQINESQLLPLTTDIPYSDIEFTYSNENIVNITDGIIVPLAIGQTTVTATYRKNTEISDTLVITVTAILPIFEIEKTALEIGKTVRISLENYRKDEFNWVISDETVININDNFIIETLKIGTSTITVTKKDNPQITASVTIEVIPIVPTISATKNVLAINDKTQLIITNLNITGFTVDDYNFSVSDSNIISIDENLVVTGLNEGEASVIVTTKFHEKSFNTFSFTVKEPTTARTELNEPAEGPLMFELENIQGVVKAGEEFNVNIIGGNDKYNYVWAPNDTTIVRVTETGTILGAKAGRTKVSVYLKENKAICGEFYITVEGTPNVNYREKIVEVGIAEEGYKEGPNNANKYGVWYQFENVEWCAIFVSWCANHAGVGTDVILKYAYCPDGVNWFSKQNRFKYRGEYQPVAGDIIFFTNGTRSSHTGIVTGCDGTKVYTIEGNTSNGVYQRQYFLTDDYILGYGVPNYPEYTE